jgi:hypothetical protein
MLGAIAGGRILPSGSFQLGERVTFEW